MQLTDAQVLALNLMRQHGIEDWRFDFDTAIRRFGACHYGLKMITLSSALTLANKEPVVRSVLLHEIAHALAGRGTNHGKKWQQICLSIGGDGNRCYSTKTTNTVPARYIGTCPNGHTIKKYRKPRSKSSCGACSPRYDERYIITYKEVVQ